MAESFEEHRTLDLSGRKSLQRAPCFRVLAELDLLRSWKETTAYKNDLHLLPIQLNELAAYLHLLALGRAPVGLFETNKEPNSDFSVEGKHEFRALMFVSRCVDELFPTSFLSVLA